MKRPKNNTTPGSHLTFSGANDVSGVKDMDALLERALDTALCSLTQDQDNDPHEAPRSTIHGWIGFSGGLDSTVLLHRLKISATRLGMSLQAIHIHHGLQPEADAWAEHCQTLCQSWNIPLWIHRVTPTPLPGESIETWARRVRYTCYQSHVNSERGDILFLAHHQQDQAETFLYRLMRGSGLTGLTGMSIHTERDGMRLCRPLLTVDRKILELYAHIHQLNWIEDPSNQNTHYDRNYIRHEILTPLRARWPHASQRISEATQHLQHAEWVLSAYLHQDLKPLVADHPFQLDLQGLAAHPSPTQSLLLRCWFETLHITMLTHAQLTTLLDEVIGARSDAKPLFHIPEGVFRRYRKTLYYLPHHLTNDRRCQQKDLPNVELQADPDIQILTVPELTRASVQIYGRHVRTHLKTLFQDLGVPPWLRETIPLIFKQDQLIFVFGEWVSLPNHDFTHRFCG